MKGVAETAISIYDDRSARFPQRRFVLPSSKNAGIIMTRSRRWWVLGLAVVLAGVAWLLEPPAHAQVKREDLRPGLVATYRDPSGVVILQLDPAMALTLHAGEAPHPRLAGDKGTIRWEGYLNVFRPSDYKFSAMLRGKFRLTVDGKDVLNAEVNGEAALKEGANVKLPAGAYPLVAEFTRLPGEARLEMYWQAPIFIKEPLAIANLKHLPAKAPQQLEKDRLVERGRFLFEELSCIRCHQPAQNDKLAQGLSWRHGPDLSNVGSRYHAGWIHAWLRDPQVIAPNAVMPRLFAEDETGRVERYAATRYLESLGGPPKPAAKPAKIEGSIKRGQQLFTSTGCAVCHQEVAKQIKSDMPLLYHVASEFGPYRTIELADQGRKTTPDKLAAFLQNPHKTDPSGRMPSLSLDTKDSQDIANYLCFGASGKGPFALPTAPAQESAAKAYEQLETNAKKRTAFQKLGDADQWLTLGKRVIVERGCNNCHTIEPGGEKLPVLVSKINFDAIQQKTSRGKGCLADRREDLGGAPDFGFHQQRPLPSDDHAALHTFLANGTKGAGSPSPIHAAKVALQRFNCLACHNRDGEGGLTEELVLQMRKYEKAENAEAILPPTLTGIGHKLRTAWFHEVLTKGGKSRPWMSLRMPQFGAAHVGMLPQAMAALEGTTTDDTIHQVKLTTEMIQVGRQLIGKDKGYGCVTCHDIAGVPNSGTRGPDLALTTQHVRYDWYRQWLESAQRMDPGTKMPSIILDGRTMLDDVLGGNADAQAQAMWAYLSLGPTLPLPEGVAPAKGLILMVKDRPQLLRTFMQDAGTRAVTVGYPVGVSTAFDATQCRLAYAWAGGFLDVTPVWANRGGAPAKILGTKFWTAPAGFPWAVSDAREPPDFTQQAANPAFGGAMPEGIIFKGEKLLFFDGYSVDAAGMPTFRYRIKIDGKQFVKISEKPSPLRSIHAVGIERFFTVEAPLKAPVLWFHAATFPLGDPKDQPAAGGGDATPLITKMAGDKLVFAGHWLKLPQKGDRAVLLTANQRLPNLANLKPRWHVHKHSGNWKIYLELDPAGPAVEMVTRVWEIQREEAGSVRELLKAQ
jgi:cbb3-type cytochrome oxidase cytochrome c subunit